MRKNFLKVLSAKQLQTLDHYVSQELLFRAYQRNQKRLAKLPPLKSPFMSLSEAEWEAILED